MPNTFAHLGVVWLVLIMGVAVMGQNKQQTQINEKKAKIKPEKAEKNESPLQQNALAALDRLLDAAKNAGDDKLKIRTQARVADVLWPFAETRARQLFEESFQAISSAQLTEPNRQAFPLAAQDKASSKTTLQGEVLSIIARRDEALAGKLLDSLVGKNEKDGMPPDRSQRDALFLQTAERVANTNPEYSVRLAQVTLENGINPAIIGVLQTLRQSSPAQADALYRSVLATARRDSVHSTVNLSLLASYALPGFTEANKPGVEQQASPQVIELLNFAYEVYTQMAFGDGSSSTPQSAGNPIDYFTGQQFLPYFARFLPEKAPAFRGAVESLGRQIPQSEMRETVNNVTKTGSPEDLTAQAEKVKDPLQRDLLYFRAASAASSRNDFERALTISGKIDNTELRESLDSFTRFQAASMLTSKNDTDTALRYARGVSNIAQRAVVFAKIARALFEQKNLARASEIMDEAEIITEKANTGMEKAQAALIIAEVRARLNPSQGFEKMNGVVKFFNQVENSIKPPKEQSFDINAMMLAMLNSIFRLEKPNFSSSFSLLARHDFNRALNLARELTNKEYSLAAQLAVCRSVLSKQMPTEKAD
jgi:tetratricopeptide (TPR) repeat protein